MCQPKFQPVGALSVHRDWTFDRYRRRLNANVRAEVCHAFTSTLRDATRLESVSFGSYRSAVGLGASAPAVASDTYIVGTRRRVQAILIRGIGMAPFDLTLLRLSAASAAPRCVW